MKLKDCNIRESIIKQKIQKDTELKGISWGIYDKIIREAIVTFADETGCRDEERGSGGKLYVRRGRAGNVRRQYVTSLSLDIETSAQGENKDLASLSMAHTSIP